MHAQGLLQVPQSAWYQDAVTLSTIIIALATVAYVVVSFLLWRATLNSANLTRAMYESGNRPYVGIEELKTERQYDSIVFHSIQIKGNLKNFGNIPAKSIVVKAWNQVEGFDPTPVEVILISMLLIPGQRLGVFKELLTKHRVLPLQGLTLKLSLDITYSGGGSQNCYYREEYAFDPKVGFNLTSSDGN